MRIFYNQSVDAIARRLIPGIAVAALAAWGVASGGAVLEECARLRRRLAEMDAKYPDFTPDFSVVKYAESIFAGTLG